MLFKISFLLFLVLNISLGQVSQEWVARYNNPFNSNDHSHELTVDELGNVYVTGHSVFQFTGYDYLTFKYNPQGSELWTARYSGPVRFDDAYGIAVDNSGNVYVTGASESSFDNFDYLTVKYNSNGIEQWTRRYNGTLDTSDLATEVAVDGNGNIIVGGISNMGSSQIAATVIKYSTDGAQLWLRSFSNSYFSSLLIDDNNNIYIYGSMLAKLDAQGNILWQISDTLTAYSPATLDQNQNILVSGSRIINNNIENFTAKYNPYGILAWYFPLINNVVDYSTDITTDGQDNVITVYKSDTSSLHNTILFSVVKISSNGSFSWQRSFLGGYYFSTIKIVTDQFDKLYITYAGGIGNQTDFVTRKLDEQGNTLWQMVYNGPAGATDSPGEIAVDNQSNVYVTGMSYGLNTGIDYCVIKYSQLIGIEPISSEIPSKFSLHQNYPNPFNPVYKNQIQRSKNLKC
ncbi:MAG: SBBP repeat-containing protein [Chlorobi bacterium]|nr:SBBP repeat-containing protein [Chlorobiota bacterium]